MAGPTIDSNGDVISSALQMSGGYTDAHSNRYGQFTLLPGQIQQIYAIDDTNNIPGSKGIMTVYDVLIHHANGTTELIRRCQLMQPMFGGGINNFMEVLPNDPGPKAIDASISLALKRGSFVLVGFIHGHKQWGVILGTLPHSNPVAVAARPKKSKGSHLEGEFQGVNWQITNDGELHVKFVGPKNDKGKPVDSSVGPTELVITKKGNVTLTTNADQSIEVDRVKKKITVTNGTSIIEMAQDQEKVTVLCDNVVVNTRKDVEVTVEGKADINVTGEATLSSQDKINLARGSTAPSEPFVLGKKFATHYKKVLNAIAAITHIGNLGAPTPPPMNAGTFASAAAEVDELLSKLIIGDN